jgi:hypothetical protein
MTNLYQRSAFEYFCFGSRSNMDHMSLPVWRASPKGGDFLKQMFGMDVDQLSREFEVFCISKNSIQGDVRSLVLSKILMLLRRHSALCKSTSR